MKGSMAARDVRLLKDRCVLLVDDVTTSGASLLEAATCSVRRELATSAPSRFATLRANLTGC